jgi:hypothetical protein
VHDVFHVSQLRKCLRVPEEQMPLEELTFGEDITYQEYPVKILDTKAPFGDGDLQSLDYYLGDMYILTPKIK